MGLELDAPVENEDGEGITIEDLAAYMKISTRTAYREVERGKYATFKKNGQTLVKPPPGYDSWKAAQVTAEGVTIQTLVAELAKSLETSRKHNERLLDLVVGPVDKILERVMAREQTLHARNDELHNKVLESTAVVERLLSEEHNRNLETLRYAAQSERLDQAMAMAKDALPTVLQALAVKGVNVRKLRAAENVLNSLPPEVIDTILAAQGEDSIIPEAAQDDAKVLLEELRKDREKQQSARPATGQPAQAQATADGVADPKAEAPNSDGETNGRNRQ